MAAKILKAQNEGTQFVVAVWLDESRQVWEEVDVTLADGTPAKARKPGSEQPDPDWVYEERYGTDVDPVLAVDQCVSQAKVVYEQKLAAEGGAIPHVLAGQRIDFRTYQPSFDPKKDKGA